MLGFSQSAPNNFLGFSGFTFQSLDNVIISCVDQDGSPMEEVLVQLNGVPLTTDETGIVQYVLNINDIWSLNAQRGGYNDYNLGGVYIEGTLFIRATLTIQPLNIFSQAGGTLLWAPSFNSFHFVDKNADGFLDSYLQDTYSLRPYMYGAGYCQKVAINELRQIQFHCNAASPTVTLKNYETDATQKTFTPSIVGSGVKKNIVGDEFPFDYFQADIDFGGLTPVPEGTYYLEIANGAVILTSEPISVGTFPNALLQEFTNWVDTDLNIWENGFTVGIRSESQLFRRLPTSSNEVLVDQDNIGRITSQRNSRGMQIDYFQLPPYMHEQLSYGWSLSKVVIKNQPFFSEEGYGDPSYTDRYNLANATIPVMTSKAFNQHIPAAP